MRTPGYYNAEGKAESSADLFIGGRYGDGPLAYYDLLHRWAADGQLDGYRRNSQDLWMGCHATC